MDRTSNAERRRRWLLWTIPSVFLVISLVLVVSLFRGPDPPEPPSPGPTQKHDGVRVSEKVTLTLPQTVRTRSTSFPVSAGEKYLLRFSVSTKKPHNSPGAAMYFGVSLSCVGPDGEDSRSIGGTQNLLSGEPVVLHNQFLYSVSGPGHRTCRMVMSSPAENAAAEGSSIDIEVEWSATRVSEEAFELDAPRLLPRTIAPGDRIPAFLHYVDLRTLRDQEVEVYATLHLTTCTMVNGSREGGRTLCAAGKTDDRGSDYDAELRADVIGPDERTCASTDILQVARHVGRRVHHQLLSMDARGSLTDTECGDSLRIQLAVDNFGPAPLAVHEKNSSLIVVPRALRSRAPGSSHGSASGPAEGGVASRMDPREFPSRQRSPAGLPSETNRRYRSSGLLNPGNIRYGFAR